MLGKVKKHLKTFRLIYIAIFIAYLAILFAPVIVFAQQTDYSNRNNNQAPLLSDLEVVFQNIIRVVTTLAGLALLFMFISGGFKFLTSEGDPKALDSAKGTLSFAVIGLVAIILAYFIIKLIADFTGLQSLLKFCIPTMAQNSCF
ncbi:MAG: pilin [Patescibacteria group bacterium]|nr:pilin [Patescibacteria group bacterium]